MTEQLDLTGARNVTWAPTIEYIYRGGPLPLTGATIRLQVRLYPGAPGDPLINVVSPAGGLTFTDLPATDAEIASGDLSAGDRVLRIFPIVARATLQAMPTGLNKPEAGQADAYDWDFVITYADAAQDRPAAGEFFLEPGVTLNA